MLWPTHRVLTHALGACELEPFLTSFAELRLAAFGSGGSLGGGFLRLLFCVASNLQLSSIQGERVVETARRRSSHESDMQKPIHHLAFAFAFAFVSRPPVHSPSLSSFAAPNVQFVTVYCCVGTQVILFQAWFTFNTIHVVPSLVLKHQVVRHPKPFSHSSCVIHDS